MTDKKVRSPLPEFKYSAEMERFQTEIDEANKTISEVNIMSGEELKSATQNAYDQAISFYRDMIEDIVANGEGYEGEEDELQEYLGNVKLLSPSEWKDYTLKKAQGKKEFYQDEKSSVEEHYYPVTCNPDNNMSYLHH